MDIISRKAILRQLLAEYRTRKEKAEVDADRVRLRIAQEVPVYGDLNGVMSRILVEASSRALAEPANAKVIAEQAQQKVRELRAQAEGALKAAGHSTKSWSPSTAAPFVRIRALWARPSMNTAAASRSR